MHLRSYTRNQHIYYLLGRLAKWCRPRSHISTGWKQGGTIYALVGVIIAKDAGIVQEGRAGQ